MAISVILVSSDSSEESVETSTGRVILFGTIPTTIPDTTPSVIPPSTHIDTALTPTSPDYTPASLDYSPASDMEFDPSEDPSSDHIPPLPATSPFLSSNDDSLESDIPDIPPSPTHGTPFTMTTLSTQRSLVASGVLRRRVLVLVLGQPIPHDCEEEDSSSSSSSSSSSKTSSDSSADTLSDPASSRSSSDHSLPTPSSGMRPSHHYVHCPSRKRSRSPAASIPLSSPISEALSYACADLLPLPKRIRSLESATDIEVSSAEGSEPSRYRGTELEMDDDVVRSDRIDIDLEIQAEIDECIAYVDALRDKGIDAKVVVEAVDREEIDMGARGPVEVRVDRVTHPMIDDDIPQACSGGESCRGHLEQDNRRLRDMIDVASQRVTRPQRKELRVQREMRQIRRFRFYDRIRITRLEACAMRHMGYRALGAHDAARNLEPLIGDGGEHGEVNGNRGNENRGNRNGGNGNGGNGNGGANGNGNGNGGGNGYNPGGSVHVARECTYQDFLKYQPLSFNGTEGVVGLTRWFEKMETVFHISNCPEKYQVKYVMCTLLNSALIWWNSHKRTIGIEAAYAMSWTELIKLMIEVYCPRNEIQKMEIELWILAVKGNDITAYTRRF
ncbi:hypothetical protein Tco_1143602 [Tanacetum coccineum]